jgi:hypothetical protein
MTERGSPMFIAFRCGLRAIATSAWFTPDQECVTSILLNVRYAVIGWNLVSLGTLTGESIVHPREVLRPAVAANAYAFVLAHNHPSGNSNPSLADHDTTRTIQTAATILKIHFVDHLIIGAAGRLRQTNPSSPSGTDSSKKAPMNAIPDNVTRFVQAHLQSLQEAAPAISIASSLWKRCSGGSKGRYIWETWTQEAIQRRATPRRD